MEKLTQSSLKGLSNRALFAYKNGRFASRFLLLGIGFLEASKKANLSFRSPSPKPQLNRTGSVFALPINFGGNSLTLTVAELGPAVKTVLLANSHSAWVTPAIFVISVDFRGLRRKNPLFLWVECTIRVFANFRQNHLFSAGDINTVFQNDRYDNPEIGPFSK